MNDDKKDALLQQIEGLIADPIPLLNLPVEDLILWADATNELCNICEDRINGGAVVKMPPGYRIIDVHWVDFEHCSGTGEEPKPAPRPIPTSERLPTEADADCAGFVWMYSRAFNEWAIEHWGAVTVDLHSHWLPTGLQRPEAPK